MAVGIRSDRDNLWLWLHWVPPMFLMKMTSNNLSIMLSYLQLNGKGSGAGITPKVTPLKKQPLPSLSIIKNVTRESASCLHTRWTKRRYDQGWKQEFYPKIKMVVEVRFEGTLRRRVASFRTYPIYPPGTWHKTCTCPYCRQARFRLMVPEDVDTIRACYALGPVRRMRNHECRDRCQNAIQWNRSKAHIQLRRLR